MLKDRTWAKRSSSLLMLLTAGDCGAFLSHPSQVSLPVGRTASRPRAHGSIQAAGKHAVRERLGPLSGPPDDGFEDEDRRQQHAPPAQLFDEDAGELAGAHDCLRGRREEADHLVRKGAREDRVPSRRHDFGEVLAACGIADRVIVEHSRRYAELAGNEGEHDVRRHLADLEPAAWAAQVEEQQREAEPGGVGALGSDSQEIIAGECEVAGDLALVDRRLKMPPPQIIAEQPPPCHRGPPPFLRRAYARQDGKRSPDRLSVLVPLPASTDPVRKRRLTTGRRTL
jgi:hypothetical protein